MEENNKKAADRGELIRFLITGLVCALADFLTMSLFAMILSRTNDILQNAVSLLAGFIVGVILNYILSTFWVFKGKQDSKVTKSVGFIIVFVIFSVIAYGLSFGTYQLCWFICLKAWNLNITESGKINYILQFKFWGDVAFWLYGLAFILKTGVGLVWNYFTRKYILYKKKEPASEQVTESTPDSEESVEE